MRVYTVTVTMEIEATSFADAEKKTQRIMVNAFNDSKGEMPSEFMTWSMEKGEKLLED